MYDVFISYSSRDYDAVRSFAEFLRDSCELSVWMDKAVILGNDNWRTEIVTAISASKYIALIVSTHSANSEDVKKEIILADERQLPIVAIYLEEAKLDPDLEYILAGKQKLRFVDKDAIIETFKTLMDSIEPSNGKPASKSNFPYSVRDKQIISQMRPIFAMGNGKSSLYLDSIPGGWKLKLCNKGPEARNVKLIVDQSASESIACNFSATMVTTGESIVAIVGQLKSDFHYNRIARSLTLSYEDEIGTPYSINIGDIVAKENRQ